MLGGYIRGQAITSGAIFVFTVLVLTLTHVPNAVALAAVAAVTDLIPLVGVYLLIAVLTLPALVVSPTTAAVVVGAMVVYQQFEDRILVPRVYGQVLRLPTIVVVLTLLAGAEVLGVVGALLALPVAAGMRVVVEYVVTIRRTSATAALAEVAPPDDAFAPDAGSGGDGPALPRLVPPLAADERERGEHGPDARAR